VDGLDNGKAGKRKSDLNEMHRKVGGIVKEDRIPPFHEVKKLFENAGFRIDFFQDHDDGYYLLTRNKSF
jgi:hypothetical protein